MWLLAETDPATSKRLDFLMDGNTKDLMDEDSFSIEIANIMQSQMGLADITRRDVVRMMGIKRTNASTLVNVGLPGANAIYPVYNLMNSFCTCNTRCNIDDQTLQITVRAQTLIRKGEQITTRYYPPWEGQPKRLHQIWDHWEPPKGIFGQVEHIISTNI